MTIGKKGQAAIEYLMTYGWAILLLTIIGVVIWQMGVLTPPSPPADCRGFSQVRPMDWKLTEQIGGGGGNLTLIIINEANTKLEVSRIEANIEGEGNCGPANINPAKNLSAAETMKQSLLNCGLPGSKQGLYYRARINITYNNVASGMNHQSTGVCWAETE